MSVDAYVAVCFWTTKVPSFRTANRPIAPEVELAQDNVRGVAVVIGARICSLAGTSEVLCSSTVRDVTTGSGLAFDDRGVHALKGIPEEWRLYEVTTA